MEKKIIKFCVVFGLMISLTGFPTIANTESGINSEMQFIIINIDDNSVSLDRKTIDFKFECSLRLEEFDGYQVTDEGSHPDIAKDSSGTLFAAHQDPSINPKYDVIVWTFSTNNGKTWAPGVYFDVPGSYPIVEYWGSDSRFFGTFFSGSDIYLFECADPTDTNTYQLHSWSLWPNIYNVKEMELACDDSQGYDNWGVLSFIASIDSFIDVPFLLGPDDELYYLEYEGFAHSSLCIDPITYPTYAFYEYYNLVWGTQCLFIWIKDFSDWSNDGETWGFGAPNDNTQYPSVTSYDDKFVYVFETDAWGDWNIGCCHSDVGFDVEELEGALVTYEGGDDRFSDVQYTEGPNFICTYLNDGTIYRTLTYDGGDHWIAEEIDYCKEDCRTSDICEEGSYVIYEKNEAIYVLDVTNNQPLITTIEGPINGKVRTRYSYNFSMVDLDGDDVYYYVDWGDETTYSWIGPYASGTKAKLSHEWEERGTYTIKAKARDIFRAVGLEGTLEMTIPKNQQISQQSTNPLFFQILQRLMNIR